MSLYFIFTIDGDWDKYFYPKLPLAQRQPDKKTLLGLIGREIKMATSLNNKFLHFIHSSSIATDFFLEPEFISIWKNIEKNGGCVGIHCHNEDCYHECNRHDDEIEKNMGSLTKSLREKGLKPIVYRGGYLTFCKKDIALLEKNGLLLDLSCDPDRCLWLNGKMIANWREAPDNYYRMSYEDHRKPGNSKVIEIPLGKSKCGELCSETTSLRNLWKTVRALSAKEKEQKIDVVVYVLSHTYEFASFWKRLKIKLVLLICKKFGEFINDKEALGIINQAQEKN